MYVPTTVPDVIDLGVNSAVQRAIQVELEVKLVNIDSLAEGRSLRAGSWVYSQDPNGGTNVPRGTFVTLYWTNRPRPLQEQQTRPPPY
jgi:hypothetical protein